MAVNIDTVLETIYTIRSAIKQNINNPSRLADLAVEATTVNSYLGDFLGEKKLEYEIKRAENFHKYFAEKPSVDRAVNLTRSDTAEIRGEITKLELLHKDIERIVSTIQTKVRILEAELKNKL